MAITAPESSPAPDGTLDKPAILVHSGPDGAPIEFESSDGPIAFDEARIKNIVESHNKMIKSLEDQYGGREKMPIGAYPPILDQHESDSTDKVVGRLNCYLAFEKRDVPKVGKNVACAVSTIRFIGQKTVEKVSDGRVYHLSVGIIDVEGSENYDTLGETSIVIEPAAPGAMLLSKGKVKQKSKEDSMSKAKLLKAHKARMTKLSAISGDITTLAGDLKTSQDTVKLAKRQSEVTHRLSKLMAGGKLTPAEHKKLDIKKLAKMSEETFSSVVEVFEAREPQIQAGQRGTVSATEASKLKADSESREAKRLKRETQKDMKRLGAKVEMAEGDDEDKDKSKEKKDMASDDKGGDEKKPMKKHMAALSAALESGDVEKAKMAYKECEAGMGDDTTMEEGSEESMKSMEEMDKKLNELTSQMARIAGAVAEMMKGEEEEGKELEADPDDAGDDK